MFCMNAKFYVAPMCKQNVYLLECKSCSNANFHISANSFQLLEQINIKYLLGETCHFYSILTSDLASGLWYRSTNVVTVLLREPAIAIRLGAHHSGTRPSNIIQNASVHGWRAEIPDMLYLWWVNPSSCSLLKTSSILPSPAHFICK